MYNNDSSVGVESDLVNSYAWDTAIVFIQEMGNENYANKTSVNTEITNTGTTMDKVCNIYDMASNCDEWSTEYSLERGNNYTNPCGFRGGYCRNSDYTALRKSTGAINNGYSTVFRVIIYINTI